MESRLGEKKSKKGREAMEPNFADVASKNTDGWTNASNVFAKFDGTKPKRHNENFVTLLVFVSARAPIDDQTRHSESFFSFVYFRLS